MKKRITALMLGGLVALSAFSYSAYAAEKKPEVKSAMHAGMMNGMAADGKDMETMMQDPEMQKKCIDMMKSPEMQAAMSSMLKTPEMQGIMKQMMQNDGELHTVMQDLVNSIDMNEHSSMQPPANSMNHSAHHQ
jgi:cytochrome bd-type quinol oxidase subunit 1